MPGLSAEHDGRPALDAREEGAGSAAAATAATALRRGATRLGRRLQAERSTPGEPLLKLSLLAHLHRRGPMHPGALAAAERLQPQSLSRTLAGLERDGLIDRRPDGEDGRRSVVAITERGEGLLRREMQGRDQWLARAMAADLTPTERELLRLAGELMERIADFAV